MPDDAEFVMTYPCYFLFGDDGGLTINTVDGNDCLCLFTSTETVQAFQRAKNLSMHGPEHVDLEVGVATNSDYDGLIGWLKSAESELAVSGIRHIVIDPVPGRPVLYTFIREFIETLPRD